MNVLISSAGRRTSLVDSFLEACDGHGKVVASDADPLAPSLMAADIGVVVPRLTEPEFVDDMLRLCQTHDIGLIVPTIDTELPLLAEHRDRFTAVGANPLVASKELIEVTASKRRTEAVFREAGISTPPSWSTDSIPVADDIELFVKPDRGSASAHTFRVDSKSIDALLPLVPDPIVQERIDAVEVTVDALLDRAGKVIHFVPRIRLKTIGGESVEGVTLPDDPIRDWLLGVLSVVADLGGWGPMTIQIFLTAPDPTLIEVNPRFGGGFPLAYRAGGLYPQWILEMMTGNELRARLGEYRKGLFMTRSFVERYVDGGWSQ